MERKPSLTPQIILAFVLASLGMALLFAGFFVPPLGGIEPSVLVAYGEVMTFAGALFGIDYHISALAHSEGT